MNRLSWVAVVILALLAGIAFVTPLFSQTPQQETPQAPPPPAPQTQAVPPAPPPRPMLPAPPPYTGPVKGPPFAGRWDSDWGALQIEVKDGKATGQYEFRLGRIEGELSPDGRTLTGFWYQAPGYALGDDGGHFSFTLTPNSKSFEGFLWRGKDKSEEPRDFMAIMTHPPNPEQKPAPKPAQPAAQAASMAGAWESDWGALDLKVEGTKVTGTFAWNNGRIEGNLAKAGHMLVGQWRKAPTYEPGEDGGTLQIMMDQKGEVLRGMYWNGDKRTGRGQTMTAVRVKAPHTSSFSERNSRRDLPNGRLRRLQADGDEPRVAPEP